MQEKSSSFKLYKDFEELVIQILNKNGFKVYDHTSRLDLGYDLLIELEGRQGIAEIKLQRKKIASLDLVKRACQQLIYSIDRNKIQVPILIISSYVKQSFKLETRRNFGILIWDITDLLLLIIQKNITNLKKFYTKLLVKMSGTLL